MKKLKIERFDLIIFFIIVIAWVSVLLAFFPGLLTSDNVDQIEQAYTKEYSSSHPIIHSFIIGNLTKIFGGIWAPALLQIVIFALIWTYACKKIRKYNNHTGNKVFQIILTFAICFNPLNYIYSIILWKDILFSYAILLIVVMTYIGIKEKFNFTFGQIALIAIASVSIMKIRYNGFPIGLVMFIILFGLHAIINRNVKKIITFIVSFITVFIIMSLPSWIYTKDDNVEVSSSTFRSTRILLVGKFLNSNITFSEDENEFLEKIIPLEIWKEKYNSYSGMNLLYCEQYDKTFLNDAQNEERFNEIVKKYSKGNEKLIISHLKDMNSIWWAMKPRCYTNVLIIDNNCVSEMSNGIYDNKTKYEKGLIRYAYWAVDTLNDPYISVLFYRPVVYIAISCIVILVLLVKERKNGIKYILLLFPMIMNIGTYVFLMISQDMRYFYPTFLTGYFMIAILGVIFKKKNDVNKNKAMNVKENPKVLIVIPAYNEALNLDSVIKDITEHTKYDYLIINDSSTDNTRDICDKKKYNIISLPLNYGLTSAIQLGMKYAKKNKYDIVIQFDGDGQHCAEYLENLVNKMICENCDIVIGSRFIKDKKPISVRMLGSRILSFIIKLVTGKTIKDPTSGMRAYSKRAIEEFYYNSSLTPEPDTLVYMIKKNMKVEEIQVKMRERLYGESYLNPIKSIKYMINMVLSIIFIRTST